MRSRPATSTPTVGSSSSTMRGRCRTLHAMFRHRFMPPERRVHAVVRSRFEAGPGQGPIDAIGQQAAPSGRSGGRRSGGSRAGSAAGRGRCPAGPIPTCSAVGSAQGRARLAAEQADRASSSRSSPAQRSASGSSCPRHWGRPAPPRCPRSSEKLACWRAWTFPKRRRPAWTSRTSGIRPRPFPSMHGSPERPACERLVLDRQQDEHAQRVEQDAVDRLREAQREERRACAKPSATATPARTVARSAEPVIAARRKQHEGKHLPAEAGARVHGRIAREWPCPRSRSWPVRSRPRARLRTCGTRRGGSRRRGPSHVRRGGRPGGA